MIKSYSKITLVPSIYSGNHFSLSAVKNEVLQDLVLVHYYFVIILL